MPAVSAINGKIEGAGGFYEDEVDDGTRFQGVASLSLPLGCLFGAQIDFGAGDLDGDGFFGAGGHSSCAIRRATSWAFMGNILTSAARTFSGFGPEAELYLDNITLSAMAGFEDVDKFDTDDVVAQIEAAYYISDDFKLYGGYRHFLSIDAGRDRI